MLLCGKAVSTNRQLGFSFGAWVKALVSSLQVRRCCVTRPPTPWMDNETILNLQSQTDKLRRGAHQSNSESSWSAFREVWRMVHRVLHPCRQPLRFDPDKLNLHFATTARRTLDVESTNQDELFQLIRGLTDKEGAFHLTKRSPENP